MEPISEFIDRKQVAKDQARVLRFVTWAASKWIFNTRIGVAVIEWVVTKFINVRSKKWVK